MSIQVNDFIWKPGENDAEYIQLLKRSNEECHKLLLKATGKLVKMARAGTTEWINVEDRLPDVDVRVLVFGIGIYEGYIGDTIIAISSMTDKNPLWPSLIIEKEWRSPWQYFFTDYKITHWMPLPEPPKEE